MDVVIKIKEYLHLPPRAVRFILGMVAVASLYYDATAAAVPTTRPSKRTGRVAMTIQNLTFARHTGVSFTQGALDAMRIDSNRALQRKDSSQDIPCRVSFRQSGSFAVFDDTGTFTLDVIDSDEEMDALTPPHVSQLVKIVNAINDCGTYSGAADGCTEPGNILVVAEPVDPLVLAHEFGHHKGLEHSDEQRFIMYAGTDTVSGSELTAPDCEAFKEGGT